MKKIFAAVLVCGVLSVLAHGARAQLVAIGDINSDQVSSGDSANNSGFSVKLVSISSLKSFKAKVTKKTSAPGNLVTRVAKASEGHYTIQVSSYLTEAEASAALEKFKQSKLLEPWSSTAEVEGKVRYRIYSGHFKTMTEARTAQAKAVEDSGVKEAFVQKVNVSLTAKNS